MFTVLPPMEPSQKATPDKMQLVSEFWLLVSGSQVTILSKQLRAGSRVETDHHWFPVQPTLSFLHGEDAARRLGSWGIIVCTNHRSGGSPLVRDYRLNPGMMPVNEIHNDGFNHGFISWQRDANARPIQSPFKITPFFMATSCPVLKPHPLELRTQRRAKKGDIGRLFKQPFKQPPVGFPKGARLWSENKFPQATPLTKGAPCEMRERRVSTPKQPPALMIYVSQIRP